MIDDENFHRALCRHQLQPELFLQRGEDVGALGIARGPPKPGESPQGRVPSETQIQIEFASKPGFIQDRPVQYQCKLSYQVRYVDLAPFYVQ